MPASLVDARRTRARDPFDVLRIIIASLATAYLAMIVWVASQRITYPFELEFIEGAVLSQASRVAHGLPLYLAPSPNYVALDYTPLYFWLGGAAVSALGHNFFALRVISIAGTAIALAAIWLLVRRAPASKAGAWVALGLFAASFRKSGAWFDVAREDSLALALTLGFLVLLRWRASRVATVLLGALLLCAAYLTKQTAPLCCLPALALLAIESPAYGWSLAALAAMMVSIAIVLLDRSTGGWFSYFTFTVPRYHSLDWRLALRFPFDDLLTWYWPAIALVLLARERIRVAQDRGSLRFHVAAVVGLCGVSWWLRCYPGCYDNVLLPAYAVLSVLVGMAYSVIERDREGASSTRLFRVSARLVLIVQFALLAWNPFAQIPSPRDREAGERLVSELRRFPASTLVPTHPYLAGMAGLPERAHIMPLMDVVRDGRGRIPQQLLAAIRDSLQRQAWSPIVLDNRDWLTEEVAAAHYEAAGRVFSTREVFWPVTGLRTRPEWIAIAARDSSEH